MLLASPHLKTRDGEVAARLRELGADEAVLDEWRAVVKERIDPDDDAGF